MAAVLVSSRAPGAELSLPSEGQLAAMSAGDLAGAFNQAESRHAVDQSFAAPESYLWAMRLRMPDEPELRRLDCRFAMDQFGAAYGDPAKAMAILERFLPGGEYADSGLLAFRARDIYARRLAAEGRVEEALNVCRQSAQACGGDVKLARGAYDALRLLFDLRLECEDGAERAAILRDCIDELQALDASATAAKTGMAGKGGDPGAAAGLLQANRASFLAVRRQRECLDALEPEGSAARLRVDLISHFRLAEACAESGEYGAARTHHQKVAELGRQWLALPGDEDTPRNLDAMHNIAIALANEGDWDSAVPLLETVWSYRTDPAAAEAEPWRAVSWLAQSRLALGEGVEAVRPMLIEALAQGERLKAADIAWIFERLAEWAAQAGGAEAAYPYARDLAELTDSPGDFNKVHASAVAWRARLEAANPELANLEASARSAAFAALSGGGRLESTDGATRLKPPAVWPKASAIGAAPEDAAAGER